MKTLKKIIFYIAAIGMMASFLLMLCTVGAHGRDLITTHELITRCLVCFGAGFIGFIVCSYTADYEEEDNGS